MMFSPLCPSSVLPLHLLPLCHLYLPLLPSNNHFLDPIQHVSSLQVARGTLQEGTSLPHMMLDVINIVLENGNEGTYLSVLVHLCGESLVIDVF